MSKTFQKGFTLIELLVVIAIIGILAAVVLIAINPAQRIAEANDSKHKSNLGQVATALESCFTANQGSYTNCGSATAGVVDASHPLVTGSYLKTALSDVTVQVTADGKNAVAYTNVAAQSNISGGVACTGSNLSYLAYHSLTGITDTKGAVCGTTVPTAP